jgi:predicted dehydrogenase
MNVAIIGCGVIGKKRAAALSGDDRIVACCDTDESASLQFSQQFGCRAFSDDRSLLSKTDCDTMIVAVVNKFTRDIVVRSLSSHKNVLAEKPLGRTPAESRTMVELSSSRMYLASDSRLDDPAVNTNLPILKTGFNHRFHPAISKAKQLIGEGVIGKLLTIRARYGHGGRAGMEKEWRCSKELCGGGELLDQGVHIIDLIRWYGGEIKTVFGKVETKFWEIEVEDSASAFLTTSMGVSASFHVSWYNWKNVFSFELFGSNGYLSIQGLGGNYGVETLEIGKRRKEGGRPEIQTMTFPQEDTSWSAEWQEFKAAVNGKREPSANGYDGLKANEVVQAIYQSSVAGRELSVDELIP